MKNKINKKVKMKITQINQILLKRSLKMKLVKPKNFHNKLN